MDVSIDKFVKGLKKLSDETGLIPSSDIRLYREGVVTNFTCAYQKDKKCSSGIERGDFIIMSCEQIDNRESTDYSNIDTTSTKKCNTQFVPFTSPVDGSEIRCNGGLREHERKHGIKQIGTDI